MTSTRIPRRTGESRAAPAAHRDRPSHYLAATESPATPAPPPTPRLDERLAATWRNDLGAALVVFLVALPLCLGIALASNAPLLSGLVTGVVGGLLVARLSGSALMVSGPAAGLTAIVGTAILELGSFESFLAAVVLAGFVQLGLGALRAGIIGYFFPSSVIRGMLTAIGLILILKQLPYAFGAGIAGGGGADGTAGRESAGMLGDIARAVGSAVPAVVAISVASLAILFLWPRLAPAALRRLLPGPLAVVLLGVGVSLALGALAPALALPASALVSIPAPGSLGELWGSLPSPDWSAVGSPAVWRVALTVGLVASLETLLSLEATDKLDPFKRTSPANRELLAQGAGNVTAGLLGGLPMTGVIVRSSANIDAGARTWRAGWLHGLFLLLAVVAIPHALNLIPLAALAAILLHTGYKLAHPKVFVQAWRAGPKYLVPFAVTVLAILVSDLLVGIAVGLAVGAFFVLLDSYRTAYSYHRVESADHHDVRITLAEEVTFLNKARINAVLHNLPAGCEATVDGSRSKHIDHDVLEILNDFRNTAHARGITLRLVGIPEPRLAAAMH
jgi:MFS superfamily sulfate permease-like transporter